MLNKSLARVKGKIHIIPDFITISEDLIYLFRIKINYIENKKPRGCLVNRLHGGSVDKLKPKTNSLYSSAVKVKKSIITNSKS